MRQHVASSRLADCVREADDPMYVIAARARVAPTDFGRIVAGRLVPNEDQAARIAAALDADPADLFPALAPA